MLTIGVICMLVLGLSVVASAEVLFEDDFSDGGAKWYFDNNFSAVRVENGELVLGTPDETGHGLATIDLPDNPFGDFVMTFTMKVNSRWGKDDAAPWNAGVIRLLCQQYGSIYNESMLWIMMGADANGTVGIFTPPGDSDNVRTWITTGHDFAQPTEIRIEKKGKEIKLFVEGNWILTIRLKGMQVEIESKDGTRTTPAIPPIRDEGYIGFFGHGAEARISNVKIVSN
jgi:hypothetical protein